MLADLCPNVNLDTSSTNSWMRYESLNLKTVFRRRARVCRPRRLLFGTDSSFFRSGGWHGKILSYEIALTNLGVSPEDAVLIFGKNLERILSPAPLSE